MQRGYISGRGGYEEPIPRFEPGFFSAWHPNQGQARLWELLQNVTIASCEESGTIRQVPSKAPAARVQRRRYVAKRTHSCPMRRQARA